MLSTLVFRTITFFFISSFLFISSFANANTLEGIRVWPSPDETRVVIDLKEEANYSYFSLDNPNRLVVDLKNTTLKANKLPMKVTNSTMLKLIRNSSPPEKETSRLVFELKRQTTTKLFKLSPTPGGQYGHRLVIDLSDPASVETAKVTSSNGKTEVSRDASQLSGMDDIIVAIDAGHGGEDPGSIGPTRKYEKRVTLDIAKKVAAKINAIPGMKAVLTRRGDYFVNLNRRSDIARKNKAHLLISIHADAFHTPKPKGASVFVLNMKRANTEIARWVENHEKQSELLGGAGEVLAKNNTDRNVSQTLLDLQFSHSQKEGYKVATKLLSEMGKVAYLHKKEPVNASLAVLKSPDIPSVLVETGFISNPIEEKLLFQQDHQNKLANALTKAVFQYFEENPPEGTLFANRGKAKQHKVQAGESLSVIANKYNVSMKSLQNVNNLTSTNVMLGQVLKIPNTSSGVALNSSNTLSSRSEMKTITHVVKQGEYLSKIAEQYNVSMNAIKQENNLTSNTLLVGKKLKITMHAKEMKPLRYHKVQQGEFLSKIAEQYQVSVGSLRKANQLISDQLLVGQRLIIPNE